MEKTPAERPEWWPDWYDGKNIDETMFCQCFVRNHPIVYCEDAFFTKEGVLYDHSVLKKAIYTVAQPFVHSNVSKKISNLVDLLKIMTFTETLPPQSDRIHLANGTLMLDGAFDEKKPEIVRSRFPICYNPNAAKPERWLHFLNDLLYLEEVELPDTLKYIGIEAFANCELLKKVNIPDSVHIIAERAFENCISLTHVSIPDNCTVHPTAFTNDHIIERRKII